MKRVALSLLLVACAPPPAEEQICKATSTWIVTHRVKAATGAELSPDDVAKPGEAKPQGIVFTAAGVAIATTNLVRNPANGFYAPAGPGHIELFNPTDLTRRALLPLRKDLSKCLNSGAIASIGGKLVVACAGTFTDDGSVAVASADAMEVDRIIDTGSSLGSVAPGVGDEAWFGSLAGGDLLRADLITGVVKNGRGGAAAIAACPSRGTTDFPFVGELLKSGNDLVATCFSHDEAAVLDVATGAIRTRLTTGDGPLAIANAGNDTWVLDNLGSTLTRLQVGAGTSKPASFALGSVPQGLAVSGTTVAITSSADGTVTFFDAAGEAPCRTASVDLKLDKGGTSFPWGVALDASAKTAFVVLNGTSEVVRIERRDAP